MREQLFVMPRVLMVFLLLVGAKAVNAQIGRAPTPNDTLTSFKILPEHKVIFRIYAPKAEQVTFSSSDIPAAG